jgi:hypothetical protein
MQGQLIGEGGLMSRVPREDDTVQLSIRQSGWKNVGDTDVVITEWPCPDPKNHPNVPYPNPDVVQGPYPEPLSEMIGSTTRELVLDFMNEEDQKEIARLEILRRCWMIVDGNNRQTGILRAIQDKNPKVPVCTRVIVNIYFTFNLYYCRVDDILLPWDTCAPRRPAP